MVHRIVMLFTAMPGPQPSARAAADSRTVRLALELLERTSILAINALAQPLARLEIRRVPGRKRHRCPGPGVAGDPRGAQSDREAAEAPDLDSPATGETCRHLLEHHLHRERDVTLDELGLLVRNAVDQLRLRHRPIVPFPCTVGPLCCGGDHSRRAVGASTALLASHIGAGARGAPDGFVREDARAPARRDATEAETNEAKTRSPEEMSLFIRSHFRTARGPGRGPVSASAVACGSPRSLSDSRFGEGERQRLLTIEDKSIKNNL